MTAFDQAWELAKMPYYIHETPKKYRREGEDWEHPTSGPHDHLYQGGKEGDPDSFFWTPDKSLAVLYAILGSDNTGMYDEKGSHYPTVREGEPQLRRAKKLDYDEYLEPDEGHEGQGVAGNMWGFDFMEDEHELPSEIIPITEEDLIDMSRDRSIHSYRYDEPNTFSGNRAEQQEALKPYMRDWR